MSMVSRALGKVAGTFSPTVRANQRMGTMIHQATGAPTPDLLTAGARQMVGGLAGQTMNAAQQAGQTGQAAMNGQIHAPVVPGSTPAGPAGPTWVKGQDITQRADELAAAQAASYPTATGQALKNLLANRAGDQFNALAEQLNARGISPQSNAFQDMLQKNLLRESTGAELQNEQAQTDLRQNLLGTFLNQNAASGASEDRYNENATATALAKKARKRQGIGSAVGAGLGGLVGSVIPGVGTLAGAGLGSQIGGSF